MSSRVSQQLSIALLLTCVPWAYLPRHRNTSFIASIICPEKKKKDYATHYYCASMMYYTAIPSAALFNRTIQIESTTQINKFNHLSRSCSHLPIVRFIHDRSTRHNLIPFLAFAIENAFRILSLATSIKI